MNHTIHQMLINNQKEYLLKMNYLLYAQTSKTEQNNKTSSSYIVKNAQNNRLPSSPKEHTFTKIKVVINYIIKYVGNTTNRLYISITSLINRFMNKKLYPTIETFLSGD